MRLRRPLLAVLIGVEDIGRLGAAQKTLHPGQQLQQARAALDAALSTMAINSPCRDRWFCSARARSRCTMTSGAFLMDRLTGRLCISSGWEPFPAGVR